MVYAASILDTVASASTHTHTRTHLPTLTHANADARAHTHSHARTLFICIYRLNLLKFALAADHFEMPVSSAGRLSDFCGVCPDLALVSSGFSSVSTRTFLPGVLSGSDSVDLTFISKFVCTSCAWNCDPWEFTTKLSPILSSGTTLL
jgi:hypothetical protein